MMCLEEKLVRDPCAFLVVPACTCLVARPVTLCYMYARG